MGIYAPSLIASPFGAEIVVDGRRLINFSGSSYLGLAGNPDMIRAGEQALHENGAGYQLARVFGIATRAHLEVEAQAADFLGVQAALYLSGGYLAGIVGLIGLKGQVARIFYDERAHFCLRDGIVATGLASHAFAHLDPGDLERTLAEQLGAREVPLIVTDGLYSTLGEVALVAALAAICETHGGYLLIDESHSFGVLGPGGRGLVAALPARSDRVLSLGSLSKALGCVGGIIAGSEADISLCRATPAGRAASAGLPAAAAMAAASLRHLRANPALVDRLRANSRYAKALLEDIGLVVGDPDIPIVAFSIGSDAANAALHQRLLDDGLHLLHSHYIGAGPGGMLRAAIFADHSLEHITRLAAALRRLL